MAQIVNLNRFRKQKARADAAQQAAENRILHGRTKEQKQREAAAAEEAQRRLDGLRRERPPEKPD